MKKTLLTVCLLATLRFVSGCIGPVPIDQPAHCEPTNTTEILNPDEACSQNILEVFASQDSAGQLYQTARLEFHSTESDPRSAGVVLVINEIPQVSTVWNGRMVGLDRATIRQISAGFWEVRVGFGTIGENQWGSSDVAFSGVGHPLTEGQEVRVRFDVCRGAECAQGVTRTYRVHVVTP